MNFNMIERKKLIISIAAWAVSAIAGPHPGRLAAEEMTIEVREVSGLARDGYPLLHRFRLPQPVRRDTPFSLRDSRGDPVIAQFAPATEGALVDTWWLDFTGAIGPWESRRFQVSYGAGVQAGSEGVRGHRLSETEQSYKITNAPYITWTIARDLSGLVRSVDFPPNEHLRPDSPGLMLRDRAGREHILGTGFHTGRVVRTGRQAVALQFTGTARDPGLSGVRSTVDLVFPTPVSWVEVDWRIDDPEDRVAGLGAALRLNLDPPRPGVPTLADFGAGTWVYTRLSADQTAELQAGGPARGPQGMGVSWRVLRGSSGRLTPIAVAPVREAGRTLDPADRPEGWAHLMDRQRCLALAVAEFGQKNADRIALTGRGDVTLWRESDPQPGGREPKTKRLHVWLHFVHYPPQYHAAASPHMMQTPPQITVIEPVPAGENSIPSRERSRQSRG
jgi:hypothetical protein